MIDTRKVEVEVGRFVEAKNRKKNGNEAALPVSRAKGEWPPRNQPRDRNTFVCLFVCFYILLLFGAAEALHLAHLMAAHGYFFPVEDHVLTVKNDGTLYRFQVKRFAISSLIGSVRNFIKFLFLA